MSKIKKAISGIVAMSMLLSVPVSAGAASIDSNNLESSYSIGSESIFNINTPGDYIAYLKQLQAESPSLQSLRSVIQLSEQSNVNDFLNKYISLPEDKQQEFVDYLNDPEFTKTVFSAMNGNVGTSQAFYSGDLVVGTSEVREIAPSLNNIIAFKKGDTKDHSLYTEATATLFGLDFIKTRVEISYRTTEVKDFSSEITSILNKKGILVQNYSPGAHITKEENNVVLASNKLTGSYSVDWSWNFIWDKLGLTIGVKRQWIDFDKAGKGDGGIYNL
ncbi:hypothetical protein A8L34_16915 [Bacillus sp. FJAT-27264]|uniref:hypothetical protein n=1 Tax=Paenibacillus sp. (strain DSM 101736 / FJAT-27264) TaxID=1850362 RepID=UPI0008080EF1|nr:hypothetical protein [Bacillus sp. FJAT-27264]OBZ11995.1 hypothetical protein A8L34_16915 [Bacillus sp. FJAT-27264]